MCSYQYAPTVVIPETQITSGIPNLSYWRICKLFDEGVVNYTYRNIMQALDLKADIEIMVIK